MTTLSRRSVLAIAAALGAPSWASRALAESDWQRHELRAAAGSRFSGRAVAFVPKGLQSDAPPRAVVLLHGYAPGASDAQRLEAWQREYGVDRAHQRLREPPIMRLYETVRYLSDRRLRELNQALAAQPYRGMVLVCPEAPAPYFSKRAAPLFQEYADWLADELVPKARAELGLSTEARDTGLAGVSMGGQLVLETLCRRPEPFGAACAVLAAISTRAAPRYAKRLAEALGELEPRKLCLLTCTRDTYRTANEALRTALSRHGLEAELTSPFGAHNSSWMREVGSLETLLFMDRALGRTTPSDLDGSDG